VKSVLLGLLDRLPGGDPLLDEDHGDPSGRVEVRVLDYGDLGPRDPSGTSEAGDDMTEEDQA
jgi:hypothetical protein